ncbi:MAG: PEP-CTERM sorting domain-containing protein [Acidobacteriota bacterium]|nr:PEP-CTERM sorting domain-containing protein [Acidobacteriota bacterium]
MNTSKALLTITVMSFLLLASQAASAETIAFGDSVKYWDEYPSNPNDNSDTIGDPNITGGTVTIGGGYITEVQFSFSTPPGWDYAIMKPGDLFIDMGANSSWDYVVSLYNGRDNGIENNKYLPTGSVDLYSTTGGTLLITGADNQGYWTGYGIRNNHPFAYTGLSVSPGSASVTGGYGSNSVIFTINGLPLTSTKFIIGFTQNCANDVVYEKILVPEDELYPAPEPSTLCLMALGLGFIGISSYRKIRS